MKTMKDFKGTGGRFYIDYDHNPISGFTLAVGNAKTGLDWEEIANVKNEADAKLFANSKKVLEAAIGVCREFDDPNDSAEAFKKLEQAINESL